MKIKTPNFIFEHTGKDVIDIDDDIVDDIKRLWESNYITFSSTGGERPVILVHDAYCDEDISCIRDILRNGGKDWIILQWRISKV